MSKNLSEDEGEAAVSEARDAALKRALTTPHKPHKPLKAKAVKKKKPKST